MGQFVERISKSVSLTSPLDFARGIFDGVSWIKSLNFSFQLRNQQKATIEIPKFTSQTKMFARAALHSRALARAHSPEHFDKIHGNPSPS